MTVAIESPAEAPLEVTRTEATRLWARLGWMSFGGPTAQIALMHRWLVDERRWLREREFLDALGFCMLLPGPEAMQLATYCGWKLHGVRGGVVAGSLFVLPGALVMLALSILYAAVGALPSVIAAFAGIKAAALALVIEALVRIGRRTLRSARYVAIALLSFVAIYVLAVPFPLIVVAAALIGWLSPAEAGGSGAPRPAVPLGGTLRTVATWLALWVVPLAALTVVFGPGHLLSQLAWFFSKLAVVTFGGAYAVLGYMSQEVVTGKGWLAPGQMIDGLGLAETTPGPLILVTEFVGFVAAHGAHPGSPWVFGLLGAAVALWSTFVPCFLWILAGAPYLTALRASPRLQEGLAAITAAVLGVILNLAVWFGLHVVFGAVETRHLSPIHLTLPQWATLEWRMVAMVVASAVLLTRFRWSVHLVIGVMAIVALATR
ncbi:MAG: chromate efflux transporter [Candidatus Eiseniibacteriota bacterium]